MKSRDFDQSIDVLDAEFASIMEKLDKMDPSSEEYEKAAKNLKQIQESKKIEVENRSEYRSGLVPQWACWAGGAALSVLSGAVYVAIDKKVGMPPIQAINFWDKFRPSGKF